MKTSIYTGKERPGAVLSTILALCILFTMGCKKTLTDDLHQQETATIQSSANPPHPAYGGFTVISWNVTGTCGQFFVIYKGDTISKLCNSSDTLKNLTGACDVGFICILSKTGRTVTGSLHIPVGDAPAPVLTVVWDTTTVPPGGSKVVSWSGINTDSIVDGKGKNVGNPNSITLGPLTKDTTLIRKAVGAGGFDLKTIHIKVASKVFSDSIILLVGPLPLGPQKKWQLTKEEKREIQSTTWTEMQMLSCELDDTLKFFLDSVYQKMQGIALCIPDGSQIWDQGTWHFLSNFTQISFNGICTISILNETTFQIAYFLPFSNIYRRDTYTCYPANKK